MKTQLPLSNDSRLLAQKLLNPNCMSDDFLSVVLVERGLDWVVWNYNEQLNGFFQGSYYSYQSDAVKEFERRGH